MTRFLSPVKLAAQSQRNSGCKDKHRHNSKGAAEAHLRSMFKLNGDNRLQPYFCPFCDGYHVGHKRQKYKH